MKGFNNYFALGLLFNGIGIISTRFEILPDIVDGLCVGLGLAFILIGILSSKYEISKIRKQKILFLKNAFKNKDS